MIPYHLLSKLRPYEVEVHGVKVKVTVVPYNDRLFSEKVSEFKKLNKKNIVGVDVKPNIVGVDVNSKPTTSISLYELLLFCVEGHCLIIPQLSLSRIKDAHTSELWQLLSDQNTCFLGSNFERIKSSSCGYYTSTKTSTKIISEKVREIGVELGRFAAMILKKPSLERKGVYELAGEIGLDVKPVTGTCPNWGAKVFSEEEIKYAVHDIYASYLIGEKLLGILYN